MQIGDADLQSGSLQDSCLVTLPSYIATRVLWQENCQSFQLILDFLFQTPCGNVKLKEPQNYTNNKNAVSLLFVCLSHGSYMNIFTIYEHIHPPCKATSKGVGTSLDNRRFQNPGIATNGLTR